MPATVGPNAQQQDYPLADGYFTYTNASTATLTVSGFDGYCHVEVGNTVARRVVSFNVNKTMNLAVAGPGGLQQDHAEAVSTVYTIYLAWKSATSHINGTADLFSVPSGTNITPAKLATLGAGYDYCSRPIGFVTNDVAGNILDFKNTGRWFKYAVAPYTMNPGVSTVQVAINCTSVIPQECKEYKVMLLAYHTYQSSVTSERVCTFWQNTNNIIHRASFGHQYGYGHARNSAVVIHVISSESPTTEISYQWTPGAPDWGAYMNINEVAL